MCDEWMPIVRVPMPIETYHRLPTHPAYKCEYFGGEAVLSPRPRTYHAQLDLERPIPIEHQASAETFQLGPVPRDDDALPKLFAGAFARTQPFSSLTSEERLDAAAECLRRTFSGVDGPWVSEASFALREKNDHIVGGILVTLLPQGDPVEVDMYQWNEPPPPDLWERGQGQPHLTWIFTHAFHKGEGIGTRLLAAAAGRLKRQGYRRLLSTFIVGNDSSQLWHWRNGFELLPSFISKRRLFAQAQGLIAPGGGGGG